MNGAASATLMKEVNIYAAKSSIKEIFGVLINGSGEKAKVCFVHEEKKNDSG